MGMDLCLFVEKLRKPRVYELVDPPPSRSGGRGWWVHDTAAFHFLNTLATSGLPNDVSGDFRREMPDASEAGFSWVRFKQVLEADHEELVDCRVTVDVHGYRAFLRTGIPRALDLGPHWVWCQDVSPEEMKRIAEWWSEGDRPFRTDLIYQEPIKERGRTSWCS